jgi:ABC-type polysaccharide/polyol phosphate export permease
MGIWSLRIASGLSSSSVSAATRDLVGGLCRTPLWGRLGWLEVKRRYHRTVLGPFWNSISLAAYAAGIGLVGSGLWNQDIHAYLPYLISGLLLWNMISTIITESCSLFVASHGLLKNVRFEYSVLVYALLWRNLIVFWHNFLVYFCIVIVLKPELLSPIVLLALPGLACVLVMSASISLLCGMLCLRFRDVQSLVTTALSIAMLITPIFWPVDALSGLHRTVFVGLNPLYHLMELVRAPLLGEVPAALNYIVVFVIMIVVGVLTFDIFRKFRKRIAFWI